MTPMRGFTLIELLIALAISAIIAVGTFYLVQSSRQTQETLVERNEYRTQLTRVVRVLEADLHQWAPARPVRDAFGDVQPALRLDIEGLRLTRAGWALSRFVELERSELQRVNYRLAEPGSELCPWRDDDEGAAEGGCLVRSQRQHLDDDGRLEWRHQMLLRPVRALTWRFLASQGEQQDYFDTWPPEVLDPGAEPPRLEAVEFSLRTGRGDRITRLVSLPTRPAGQEADDED